MKTKLTILFCLMLCLSNASKGNTESELTLDSLIEKGKYASAWSFLNKLYEDSTSESTLKKANFCLKYFSHSHYHLKFYFADLAPNEKLSTLRQKEISTTEIEADFNPEKSLLNSLRKDENNAALHFALGEFYYDVVLTYRDTWKKGTKETMALYYYHFMEAYNKNIKTDLSCYAISYFYQSRQTFAKAKKFLLEALQINPNFAAAHYNLAYSYNIEDSLELAISHAHKAFDNYDRKSLKSDAASMCGILYGDLKKHEDAINWLLIADAMSPGSVVVYEALLKSYLSLGKKEEAKLITKNLYAYDWRTGRIFNSIENSYLELNQGAMLEKFLANEIQSEPVDKEYQGFTYMHLAQMYINLNEKDKASINLSNAKASFDICYDKDHAIYSVLEKLTWTIEQL